MLRQKLGGGSYSYSDVNRTLFQSTSATAFVLARVLLLLAHFGKEGKPESVIS